MIKLGITFLAIAAFARPFAMSQKTNETDWQPPIASGGAPECPEHSGSRTHRSETITNGTTRVQIVGTTIRHTSKKCEYKAELVFSGAVNRTLSLTPSERASFEVADFSPDGKSVLLVANGDFAIPDADIRNVRISAVPVGRGEITPIEVWDLFGWKQCEATVEPQGFTAQGRVMLLARPSVYQRKDRHDCVADWGLYATDLVSPPVRLPDDTKVPRFGKVLAGESQACKSDPDIVDACYTVHGRLSAWNGTPTGRIWISGSKRILGVLDDFPYPSNLQEQVGWDVEAWGDFEVCPFTKDRAGAMRMVCVESASHVTYRDRK
jgi:hypothetical protein